MQACSKEVRLQASLAAAGYRKPLGSGRLSTEKREGPTQGGQRADFVTARRVLLSPSGPVERKRGMGIDQHVGRGRGLLQARTQVAEEDQVDILIVAIDDLVEGWRSGQALSDLRKVVRRAGTYQ